MVPTNIKDIWTPTEKDIFMINVAQRQRKIKERLQFHESILKELLGYLTKYDEGVFRSPPESKKLSG